MYKIKLWLSHFFPVVSSTLWKYNLEINENVIYRPRSVRIGKTMPSASSAARGRWNTWPLHDSVRPPPPSQSWETRELCKKMRNHQLLGEGGEGKGGVPTILTGVACLMFALFWVLKRGKINLLSFASFITSHLGVFDILVWYFTTVSKNLPHGYAKAPDITFGCEALPGQAL